MTSEPQSTDRPEAARDTRFLLVVGAMLLVIIASLSALWLRERARRIRAEVAYTRVRGINRRLEGVLGKVLSQQAPRVRRSRLPVDIHQLDGQPRRVLHLDARQAERLGFAPGDLISVDARIATSQPRSGSP